MRACSTLNKKRRKADVLRCVRRRQRGEYVFAPHAEIDRFLWHAREPFDDAQLTALCEPSSSVAANAVDSDAVLAPLRPPATCRRRDARGGSVSSCLSTVFRRTASKPATPTPSSSRRRLPLPRAARQVCSASRRRRRQPQEPGPQPSRLDPCASAVQRHRARRYDKQADLETERLRLKAAKRCRVGARKDAAAATAATTHAVVSN